MRSLPLLCHPSTPSPFVRSLRVHIQERTDRALSLRYELDGDVQRLLIPSQKSPTRTDELWRHTCFEAFLRPEAATAYLELNFAPSGEWAAYEFQGHRIGMTAAAAVAAPTIACARTPSHLQVSVSANIPSAMGHVRLALAAVIEDREGRVSYWALAHPPGKPDFHHEDGFAASY